MATLEDASEPLPFQVPASLLAYLAVARDWVSRHELAYLYRPDEPDTVALQYLRLQLHRAQRYPWATGIEVEADQVRWQVASDVTAFDEAYRAGDWRTTVQAYGGPFMAGFALRERPAFDTWLELERGSREQRYRTALERHAAALEVDGASSEAADVLGVLADLDLLDEEAAVAHLRMLGRAGRKGEAERRYERLAEALREALGVEPAPETREAMAHVRADVAVAVRIERPSMAVARLPEPATRFLGREVELADLETLFGRDDCRLVTLLGFGGIGKTRLALEFARRRAHAYPDGVAFVNLIAVHDEAHLLERIAEAAGLELDGDGDALEQLGVHLAGREALLVLDNFDDLAHATAPVAALTSESARLQVLVTSRQRLGLRGEHVYDLRGLATARTEAAPVDADDLPEAIALFVSAARRVAPRLAFDPDDLQHVARIADQVQGLPLALELAAAWVRVLPVARIADEIARGYDLLETDLADLPDRHRSLRAVLDRTWSALSTAKRDALMRLSVIAGACTLEAAEAVTGAPRAVFLSLLNESLVQRVDSDRFASHPLVVQYAAQALEALPAVRDSACDAHAAHYEARLRGIAERSEQGSSDALRALEPDLANLERAWLWLIDAAAYERALAIAKPLFDHYTVLGHYRQGSELCRATFAHLPAADAPEATELRCTIELIAATTARELGDLVAARAWCEAAAARAAAHGFAPLAARAAQYLGDVLQTTGEFDAAQQAYERAVAGFEALDRTHELANTLNSLGALDAMRERLDEAEARFRRCVVLFGQEGDELSRATALTNLGYLADVRGDAGEAARRYEQGLAVYERHGYARGVSAIKNNLVVLYGMLGRLDEAEAMGRASLAIKEAVGDTVGSVITLKNLGDLQLLRGTPERAPEFYLPALQAALDADATPRLLQVLAAYLGYLERTGATDLADEAAAALLSHPVAPPSVREKALRARPHVVEPAPNPARTLDVVQRILYGA